MTDTDRSELGPDDRDTLPPPRTLEEMMTALEAALSESNALTILQREASQRCADKVVELLQALQAETLARKALDRRVGRIERHLNLPELAAE